MTFPRRSLFVFIILCLGNLLVLAAQEEPKYGAIEISSSPSAASVYVEGFLVGETPCKVDQVLPGDYRIVVKSNGHEDFVTDVDVQVGEIAKVDATLTGGKGWSSPVRDEDDWTPIQDQDKKQYEQAKSKTQFRRYKVLEISNFLTKSDEVVPPDHLFALLRGVAARLDEKTEFERFATNYTAGKSERWQETGAAEGEPTLVLSGVITRYQRGSRAKRYMVGFGAGKTRMYCLFRFVDKATGEVLLERMENGSISGGLSLFGGASDKAVKELANDIVKTIQKNW